MLRSIFLALSRSRRARAFLESSSVGKRLSSRFVAGTTVDEALAVCEQLNREGIAVSLDSLGESVTDESQARTSAAMYHGLLDAIKERGLTANVSVKLTQVGMDIDASLAERIMAEMVEHAAAKRLFVRVDMEVRAIRRRRSR